MEEMLSSTGVVSNHSDEETTSPVLYSGDL